MTGQDAGRRGELVEVIRDGLEVYRRDCEQAGAVNVNVNFFAYAIAEKVDAAVAEAVKEERNWWHEQTVRLAEAEQVRLAERDEAIVELNQMAADDRAEIERLRVQLAEAVKERDAEIARLQEMLDLFKVSDAEARREERERAVRIVEGFKHRVSDEQGWRRDINAGLDHIASAILGSSASAPDEGASHG